MMKKKLFVLTLCLVVTAIGSFILFGEELTLNETKELIREAYKSWLDSVIGEYTVKLSTGKSVRISANLDKTQGLYNCGPYGFKMDNKYIKELEKWVTSSGTPNGLKLLPCQYKTNLDMYAVNVQNSRSNKIMFNYHVWLFCPCDK